MPVWIIARCRYIGKKLDEHDVLGVIFSVTLAWLVRQRELTEPWCFGTRPSPQDQAEYCCHDCPFDDRGARRVGNRAR